MSSGRMSKRTTGHAVKRSIDLVDDSTKRPSASELKAKIKPFSPAEFKRSALGLASGAHIPKTNGVKDLDQNKFDQSRAVVITGTDLVDTNMGDDEDGDSESDSSASADEPDDESMHDEATDENTAVIRFENPIDVDSAFPQNSLVVTSNQVSVPATSLSTVLSQAIRTSDNTLLESCLNTPDEETISATIQRLDSALAASLLQKLAERLHRRPGRAGNLMKWVQLTLVAHGGYLASRKEIVHELSSLHKVITERTNSLKPLLALKGRLDMLDAQMRMREQLQKQQLAIQSADDSALVYIEDEEEEDDAEDSEDSGSEDESVKASELPSDDVNAIENLSDSDSETESSPNGISLSSDDMPTTKVKTHDEDEDEESDEEALVDDEASETSRDTGDDESNSESDPDAEDSEDLGSLDDFIVDDEEELPKPKKRRR